MALLVVLAGCDKLLNLSPVVAPPGPPAWKSAAAGGFHTCGIHTDGTLWCWGDNTYGQVAGGFVAEVDEPAQVGTARWASIAAGYQFTCGIQLDDSLWCWGSNQYLQTGIGGRGQVASSDRLDETVFLETPEPTVVGGAWTQVTAGETFACGIQTDGSLWCWGDDFFGQLADPTTDLQRPSPIRVGDATWKSVSAGAVHACGIRSDDSLWCWGFNGAGQLGAGSLDTTSSTPLQVTGTWTAVGAGNLSTCAIASDGRTYCFGMQFGGSPVAVALPDGVALAIGGDPTLYTATVCGVSDDGSVSCLGDGAHGQLGHGGGDAPSMTPIELTGGKPPWRDITVGARHVCAIDSDDGLWCLGAGSRGQLGDGGTAHLSPAPVPGTWAQIAAGLRSTCALDSAGRAYCAGDNSFGGVGDGTVVDRSSLVPIATSTPMTTIAPGEEDACALDASGTAWCWGINSNFELGDNQMAGTLVKTPTRTISLGFTTISMATHGCGIDGNSVLYCWGYNGQSEVGNASTIDASVPVQIGGDHWRTVSAGHVHSCGIATSGLAYCWGKSDDGETGVAGMPPPTEQSPVQIGAAYLSIVAGGFHSCAIATDHTAWCWGYGAFGQVGIGGLGDVAIPRQVGTATWQQLSLGTLHTCGIQMDHSLWCWGENDFGQLGDGTLAAREVPTAIGEPGKTWAAVAAGGRHTCALDSDGTAWCWGDNDQGQLADGSSWRDQLGLVP
jgi:alpha-tubulin suppressor-like RCC1 family protein